MKVGILFLSNWKTDDFAMGLLESRAVNVRAMINNAMRDVGFALPKGHPCFAIHIYAVEY